MNTYFSDKELFKILTRYTGKHKILVILTIILFIISTTLSIFSPVLFQYILNKIEFKNINLHLLLNLGYIYILLSIIAWLFNSIQFVVTTKLNARVVRDIRIDAYSGILKNKQSFYDMQKSGDLTSRIVNDTRELYEASRDIAWMIPNILRLLGTIAVLFYFSIYISVATLIVIPLILLAAVILGKYERKTSAVWRKNFGEVNQRFSEIMSKIHISKTFNREDENKIRFKEINEATYKASVKRGFAIFIFWPLTDLFKHLLLFMVLIVGTWEVQTHGLPISTFILYIILINYYYWPLINIASNYPKFQGAFANLERIANTTMRPDLYEENNGKIQPPISGNIEFRNVSFGYNENIVLHNISFDIKPGERVAIVGETGAGKSTIAALLVRLYEINSGKILIDGIPIQNFDLYYLRKSIGLVSQRVLLFKGTIRENLQVANPNATDNDIWDALEMVQAREFIELLPNGLDSMIEENGKNLSAGQKQMISFARVILSNPRIIILDEATANVDLYTEAKIQMAIEKILDTTTSISIAHRLTTILRSDKIIVIDKGRIIQIGTHDELVNQGGLYSEMYELYMQTQSAKYLNKIKIRKQ